MSEASTNELCRAGENDRARLRPWPGAAAADVYLEESIQRIEAFEPSVGAFTHHREHALREAVNDLAWKARGILPGALDSGMPLSGMPVAIKEIIDSADLPTEYGSELFRGRRPARNAECVQRMVDAGALVLGMTTSTPFACGTTTTTANPHRLEHTPGGSSAGSGAAIGAGFVPVALATQTGASTLRPASYCGAYGFKPTHGRYPMAGVHPLADTLDDVGIIAASLADIERVDAVIADRARACRPEPHPTTIRIGWVNLDAGDEPHEKSWAALREARTLLQRAGMIVADPSQSEELASFDTLVRGSTSRMFDIFAAESAPRLREYVERDLPESDPRLAELLERARSIDADELAAAYALRSRLRQAHAALSGSFDVLATLATVNSAPAGRARTGSRTMPATSSYLGLPALSLPLLSEAGMPLGLQLIGFDALDEELFAIARAVETAFDGVASGLSSTAPAIGDVEI